MVGDVGAGWERVSVVLIKQDASLKLGAGERRTNLARGGIGEYRGVAKFRHHPRRGQDLDGIWRGFPAFRGPYGARGFFFLRGTTYAGW